jgi:hypothetical protein
VHVEWSTQVEDILASEGEKCRCLSWIHTRCETEMSRYNTMIQVPVIILSTLAGTASVGSATLFAGQTTISSIAIGLVSISVGILNTLGGFFNYAKRAESHRIAHLHYSKISTKIAIELSLPRLERIAADSLLNYVRESMERLAETTPLAPDKILKRFKSEFKNLAESISMPAETNGLHKIKIYRSNGPIPTPVAFTLNTMENVEQSHAHAGHGHGMHPHGHTIEDRAINSKLFQLKLEQEESSRRVASEFQEKHAAAMEQLKRTFQEKQAQFEKQLKLMETTLLPITEAQFDDDAEASIPNEIQFVPDENV